MALIKCEECGKKISDKAKTCNECGYPIRKIETNKTYLYLVICATLSSLAWFFAGMICGIALLGCSFAGLKEINKRAHPVAFWALNAFGVYGGFILAFMSNNLYEDEYGYITAIIIGFVMHAVFVLLPLRKLNKK